MAIAWWRERAYAKRFVADLLAGELARTRRSAVGLPPAPWAEDLTLASLGVDSLERVELATALAEAIHLHRAGVEDTLLARASLAGWIDVAREGLDAWSEEMTFHTSGSAGDPKACTHAAAALAQEAEELARLFAGSRRIVAAVPCHHIYGFLFTVLLPQALGLPAQAVIDARRRAVPSLGPLLQPGDLVVGHPDFWRLAARTLRQVAHGVAGVTSTAPCPDEVSEDVARAGFGSFVHVYGSSETAGVGWRASHRDPYCLFPFWTRAPDDPASLVRTLPGGAHLAARVQDEIEWLDERRFRVGSRRDRAVQVGGINVYPQRVRETLLRLPGVREAAVRPMAPHEGARLKAFIVPEDHVLDLNAFEARVREWIDGELTAPERPRALRFGPALPRSAAGKLADWPLEPGGAPATLAS